MEGLSTLSQEEVNMMIVSIWKNKSLLIDKAAGLAVLPVLSKNSSTA
jgi:hypothetical protein